MVAPSNRSNVYRSNWLYEVCRGIDNEKVKERHLAESVGCSKNFTGGNCLDTRTKVSYWMRQLATELVERLEKEKNAVIMFYFSSKFSYLFRFVLLNLKKFDTLLSKIDCYRTTCDQ